MVSSNVMPRVSSISRDPADLFTNKYNVFRKGQISLPMWLKREADGRYFSEFTKATDLPALGKWLSGEDENFSIDEYNAFSTGVDMGSRNKITLLHFDESDTPAKIAVFIVPNTELAMLVLELVDEHCGE